MDCDKEQGKIGGSKTHKKKYKKQTVVANSTTEAEYVAAFSCRGQFWTTAKSKTVNVEVQILALVDGIKVIITKSSVRRDLQLADEDERRVKKLEKKHSVGNKMHKAFPLPGESSHWQYKFPLPVKVSPTARRLEMPLPEVCIVIEEMMKKLPVKDRWQLH
nr:hypothetical protein [Tanacetum cinerariifolium]